MYTTFEFPCPRCNRVERLVDKSDLCRHCHNGLHQALKEQHLYPVTRVQKLLAAREATARRAAA